MVYYATDLTETIYMHNENNCHDVHCISLTKSGETPTFYVTCCCNENWIWEFYMDNISNYEMVKHVIVDTIMECDDMREVLEELDAQFEEIFDDIVVWDDCDEDCCEKCNHRGCLN